MPTGTPTSVPPAGFVSFCMRFQDQCAMPSNVSPVVIATPAVWQLLNRVNSQVNESITPEDDIQHYGRAEYWTIPTDGYGNCHDYALTKRKDLIEAGIPENALRMAVVKTWNGEGHAVLTVSTDRGDYVLDNLREGIVSWKDTDYTWLKRQAADNPWNWVALGVDSEGTVVASALSEDGAPITTGAR